MQERKEGKFDEFLKDHAEECFGEDAGDLAADDEDRSGSDWEREQGKKYNHTDVEPVVEKLLRHSRDGTRIEVKWKGYEKLTWESRVRLLEDVPDMVAAVESQERRDLEPAASEAPEYMTT